MVKQMYVIEHDIPLPCDGNDGRSKRPKSDLRLALGKMKVGDSILCVDWQNERIRVDKICGEIGIAYTTRKIEPRNYNHVRLWRVK